MIARLVFAAVMTLYRRFTPAFSRMARAVVRWILRSLDRAEALSPAMYLRTSSNLLSGLSRLALGGMTKFGCGVEWTMD